MTESSANSGSAEAAREATSAPGLLEFTRDERANALTHGLGFVLSLLAMAYFWLATSEVKSGLRLSCVIFTASMASVYLCSTLSHAVLSLPARQRWRAWDQGTIYLLIAGTYTPFIFQGSPPGWRAVIMGSVWLAAAAGFFSKVVQGYRVEAMSPVTYVLLGWLPAVPLIARTPMLCVLWMVLGGLSYTLGIAFLVNSRKFWFAHALWHIAVMLGSLCHGIAIHALIQQAA